jgi:hypothetical protein
MWLTQGVAFDAYWQTGQMVSDLSLNADASQAALTRRPLVVSYLVRWASFAKEYGNG